MVSKGRMVSATIAIAIIGYGMYVACKDPPADNKEPPKDNPIKEEPGKSVDPTTTGTVAGTITFTGKLPAPTMIRATSDAACAKSHPGEFDSGDVTVHDGKVENAFVWVKSGLEAYRFP